MPDDAAPDTATPQLMRVFTEIGIIHQLTNAAAREALAPLLNPSEFGLLNHFSVRGDGQTPTDLARVMQVTKPSMTAMLAKLARKGLVTMTADESDARRLRVQRTDDGRLAHADAARKLAARVAATTVDVDKSALIALLPALVNLREALDRARD